MLDFKKIKHTFPKIFSIRNTPIIKMFIIGDWLIIILIYKGNIDFITENINDNNIYIRNKTNKLYNGNINSNEKYFLLCGNIPFPCMPERNRICVDRIEVKNSYMYIYHNFDNNDCKELFNSNMVF